MNTTTIAIDRNDDVQGHLIFLGLVVLGGAALLAGCDNNNTSTQTNTNLNSPKSTQSNGSTTQAGSGAPRPQ